LTPKGMPMGNQNDLHVADENSGAHNIWRLGNTGIELQRGRNVSSYKLPAHFHDDYQFMLVESGAREISFRGDKRVFGGDFLTIVNPGETHSTSCHGEHGSSFKTMHLPMSVWAKGHDQLGMISGEPLFPFAVENGYVLKLFSRLHGLVESEGSTLQSEELLAEFADALVSSCKLRRRNERPKGVRRRIYLVRDCIEDNFAKPLTLDELAGVASLSKYQLVRSFSDALGMPPHAFQIRVRLNRAKKMLSDGMPIKQVAAATGFTDPSHFGKQFFRLIGFTPRSYQRAVDIRQDRRH
jgi:AraC-like DNA-binding protein